jgi:L-ribulose-5-phosphate 3-epimerase UlaE
MTTPLKFNRRCTFDFCDAWMRSDAIFCNPHYRSLPREMQLALWTKDMKKLSAAIKAAEEWLEDKMNNALIVLEEGP